MTPARPPFLLTYWNPFDKYAPGIGQFFLNYIKDISLADYTANSVGSYIEEASEKQISVLKEGFSFLDQAMARIEQTLINSNILLEDIADLLRLPDYEKQRQRHIELGLKFSNQALLDPDIAIDAKVELENALIIMPQDWFVLQQLGILFLYQEKTHDISKAKEFFLKAAKYAAVDLKSPGSLIINNLFKTKFTVPYLSEDDESKNLEDFVRECYLNAALCSYILCDFIEAVDHARKSSLTNPKSLFLTAKYLSRTENTLEALECLKMAIEKVPYLSIAARSDQDIKSNPQAIEFATKSLDEYVEKLNTIKNRIHEIKDFISNKKVFSLKTDFGEHINVVANYEILNEPLTKIVDQDPLFLDAAKIVVLAQSASTSLLSRKLVLGYVRTTRLIDMLKNAGIVGPSDLSESTEIFIKSEKELNDFFKNDGRIYIDDQYRQKKELLQAYNVEDLWGKWDEICNLTESIKVKEKRLALEDETRLQEQRLKDIAATENKILLFDKIKQEALYNQEFGQYKQAYYSAVKGLGINSFDTELQSIQLSFEAKLRVSNKRGCFIDIIIIIFIGIGILLANFYYNFSNDYGAFFKIIFAFIVIGIVRYTKRLLRFEKV